MHTGEMVVPTLVKWVKFGRDWGWIVFALFVAFGWNFSTPASKMDALNRQLLILRDSVHAMSDKQREQGILIEWQTHVICRGLTDLERGVAYPCRTAP